jgi:hypothetical protein
VDIVEPLPADLADFGMALFVDAVQELLLFRGRVARTADQYFVWHVDEIRALGSKAKCFCLDVWCRGKKIIRSA